MDIQTIQNFRRSLRSIEREVEQQIKNAQQKLADLQKTERMLKEEVDAEDIAQVVSNWTHIPVNRLMETEKAKLLHMEDRLRRCCSKSATMPTRAVAVLSDHGGTWRGRNCRRNAWAKQEVTRPGCRPYPPDDHPSILCSLQKRAFVRASV